MLQFFQLFLEEENRPPRLHEIGLRFGLSEDSARIHICVLEKGGFLLPLETENSFLQILNPWTNSSSAHPIPILGAIGASIPDYSLQEANGFLPVPLEKLGITPSENIFALEVRGESMIGKHIIAGDFVVFNKAKPAMHGNVVAALVDNQTTLKTYLELNGKKFLRAENPTYKDIIPADELQVQGVMICLVRQYS